MPVEEDALLRDVVPISDMRLLRLEPGMGRPSSDVDEVCSAIMLSFDDAILLPRTLLHGETDRPI